MSNQSKPAIRLFLLGCIGAVVLAAVHLYPQTITSEADVAQRAVERYSAAQEALWQARNEAVSEEIRAELLQTDPNKTGLVGIEWSGITSTPGNLEAKQLSADTLWPALFVRWYRQAGLQPGDRVAIAASGSFPALFLAARIAAEEAGLEPVIVASLSASNYGANIEEFDLLAMEEALLAANLIRTPIHTVTPGAGQDRGAGLDREPREMLLARVTNAAAIPNATIAPLHPANLRDAIEQRDRIFFPQNGSAVKLLVNIGGNAANYGSGVETLSMPTGLITGEEGLSLTGESGVLKGDSAAHRAMRRGVPVLHVLAVKKLFESEAGESPTGTEAIFTERAPGTRFIAIASAILLLFAMMGIPRHKLPEAYRPS